MLKILKIEDCNNKMRLEAKRIKDKKIRQNCLKTCKPPWVALKTDDGLNFIRGYWNYENSNTEGTKGITVSFFLESDKEYLVFDPNKNETYMLKYGG